ncbi:MAG: cysteine desulfurase NifS [bacterium]|nr:cysteine desulfurase NifS [bacterium]MBU1917845.1 cysteine desulfurase NifS [bacterium]
MKLVYADNNATTQIDSIVLDEMLPFLKEYYGNPSSMYGLAEKSGTKIKEARQRVAALINASEDEIIFTSCGTESNNTAVHAALEKQPEKKHIITTRVEHPAIKSLCERLARNGYRVTFVPVDKKGNLDTQLLFKSITKDTAIVSVMWANNETGVLFPVQEIAEDVRKKGIVFHTDAVQAVGKIPVDVKSAGVDMLTLSGHKIHAPKGVAALYVRKGLPFASYLIGGHQERGRRGGTENVASIVALGKACQLAGSRLEVMNTKIRAMRDRLENELLEKIPNSAINGNRENRVPSTTNVGFNSIEGEAILLMLDQLGICASSGSACTSGSLEPSHVLRAMNVPFTSAHGSVRFSFSTYNEEKEVDYIVEKLPPIIARLRELSPFWKQ